jgi:hypothetical protein
MGRWVLDGDVVLGKDLHREQPLLPDPKRKIKPVKSA